MLQGNRGCLIASRQLEKGQDIGLQQRSIKRWRNVRKVRCQHRVDGGAGKRNVNPFPGAVGVGVVQGIDAQACVICAVEGECDVAGVVGAVVPPLSVAQASQRN